MRIQTRRPPGWSKSILGPLAVALCVLVVAACGSNGNVGASGGGAAATTAKTTPAAKKPTGAPIVTYTYTDVNTEGPAQKDLAETQRVTAEWINAHGGIGGRPLEAKFCDARGTPTAAAECARKAVADKAVAVVGSFSFTGDAVVPILEQANIALFGNCCPVSAAELTSPASFPLGTDPVWGAGLVKKAVDQACKHINAVLIQGAEGFKPLLDNAAKSRGTSIGKYVTLPAKAGDYSPQVAQATSGGADCLVMVVAETAYTGWMTAYAQSGSKARMYGPEGNFSKTVVKGFEPLVEGHVIAGAYPDISLPQWADYRKALETYKAAGEDYDSLGGLGTWSAFMAFKQIVEGMSGEVTNKTFMEAVKTAKIHLPGMVAPVDFSKPWSKDGGPKGFDRIFNRCVAFAEFKDGTPSPLGDKFEDVSAIAGGSKPMDCGPSFG